MGRVLIGVRTLYGSNTSCSSGICVSGSTYCRSTGTMTSLVRTTFPGVGNGMRVGSVNAAVKDRANPKAITLFF